MMVQEHISLRQLLLREEDVLSWYSMPIRQTSSAKVRDVLGDVDAFEEPIDRLETYQRFQPDHFDRRRINRRLKQWAEDNKMCISE